MIHDTNHRTTTMLVNPSTGNTNRRSVEMAHTSTEISPATKTALAPIWLTRSAGSALRFMVVTLNPPRRF